MNTRNRGLTLLERAEIDGFISTGQRIRWRLLPTLIGGIVGDALGVPVEFTKRDCGITGMQGYGTYNQPAGTWSDDTSLTLCLMETLFEEGSPDDLMHKFVKYQKEGYLTPYGQMFDIGMATQQAISRFLSGIPAKECGGKLEADNGNGSLMRIAPLIAVLLDELDVTVRHNEIKKWAEITHAHPRSLLGCYIYMDFLFGLSCNKSLIDALSYAIKCNENIGTPYIEELSHYARILDKSIVTASRDSIKSTGYIVDSFEAALWCLFNTNRYEEAVLAAVNLGGDTDTIAFITGTLAGMFYKIEAISQEWIDQLADKDNLLDRCESFMKYFTDKLLLAQYGTLDVMDFETSREHQLKMRKNNVLGKQ